MYLQFSECCNVVFIIYFLILLCDIINIAESPTLHMNSAKLLHRC